MYRIFLVWLSVILVFGISLSFLNNTRVESQDFSAVHCQGVDPSEAIYLVERMIYARDIHQNISDNPDRIVQNPIIGPKEWHDEWVKTYNDLLLLISKTMRGCV